MKWVFIATKEIVQWELEARLCLYAAPFTIQQRKKKVWPADCTHTVKLIEGKILRKNN